MLSIEEEPAPIFEVISSVQPVLILSQVVDDKVHEPQLELIVLSVAFGELSEAIVDEIAK